MKYAVLALLGLTTVNAESAKKPENLASIGGLCGKVLDVDKCTGKDTEKQMDCDVGFVCGTLDFTNYKGEGRTTSYAKSLGTDHIKIWGLPSPEFEEAGKDANDKDKPKVETDADKKENVKKFADAWTELGKKKMQKRCVWPHMCNYTNFGIKITCGTDVGDSCDADCLREKWDEINKLGSGAHRWDRCNIYSANTGCRHV